MGKAESKASLASSQRRVKLHIFEPSGRRIWTVVGTESEHWQSPEMEFCSCRGFYFGRQSAQRGCSHLESIKLARKSGSVEEIRFADEEFDGFIAGLISEL